MPGKWLVSALFAQALIYQISIAFNGLQGSWWRVRTTIRARHWSGRKSSKCLPCNVLSSESSQPGIGHNSGAGLDDPHPHISPGRKEHILEGDGKSGGHRSGTGVPGATEFPEDWDDEDILDGIEEVYGSGEEVDGLADDPDYIGLRGKYKGIEIEVIVDGDGNVVTGYPSPGQEGVKENPKEEKEW